MTNLIAVVTVALATNVSDVVTRREPQQIMGQNGAMPMLFYGENQKPLEITRTTTCEEVRTATFEFDGQQHSVSTRRTLWSSNVVLTLKEQWVAGAPYETPKAPPTFKEGFVLYTNAVVGHFLTISNSWR